MMITSDRDRGYNCIAWAMGDATQFWWPEADAYWPDGVQRQATVQAFSDAFATVGFKQCTDGTHEPGKEKVALYTLAGAPTHASFLTERGTWASKLGRDHDVEHVTLGCISGYGQNDYGDATHFFVRDLPAVPRPKMPNVMFEKAQTLELTNESQGRLKKPAPGAKKAVAEGSPSKKKHRH